MKWSTYRLDQCTEIISGSTPKTDIEKYWDGDINWATPKDLSNLNQKIISDTPDKITQEGYDSCSTQLLPVGSVLFSSRAPIGHVAINGVPMCTNQGFKSFIPKKELLDASYLYYWLIFKRDYLQSLGNGATFKEVSKATIARVEIPLPPLEEQRRIAAILDKAAALRTKRREAIAKLDQLLQSVFLEMFGDITSNPKKWKKEKLINLVEIDAPLVDPLLKDFSDLLHYGPDRIEKETGKLLPAKTAKEDLIISKKFLCNEKHILYSKIRPNLNKVALCNAKCLCSADVYPIEVKNQLNRVFLWVVLRSKDFLRYAEGFSNRANIPKINRDQLLGYECIIPPLNIQDKFSEKVFQIMEIEMKLTQSDELIQKNISALQQKFFNS